MPTLSSSDITKLINAHRLISQQIDKARLHVLLSELNKVLDAGVAGEVTEFGCYTGTAGLFIRRLLDLTEQSSGRQYFAYDSFEGLPPKSIKDASVAGSDFKAGELKATKRDLIKNFKHAGLKPPIVTKGWFGELKSKKLPELISFAFLDGDFYESITDSLNIVWPRLNVGGRIVVDDYEKAGLPGVSRAVNDFFTGKDTKVINKKGMALIAKV